MRNCERLSNAGSNPKRFPYAYQTLRKKYGNGELRGIVFKHAGRLWFDWDEWNEQLEQARQKSLK